MTGIMAAVYAFPRKKQGAQSGSSFSAGCVLLSTLAGGNRQG
jgi:hypothetical protein